MEADRSLLAAIGSREGGKGGTIPPEGEIVFVMFVTGVVD